MSSSRELLKPVSLGYILFTTLLALLFALIPWNPVIRSVLPDCVLWILLYWGLHQPRHVGLGFAFFLGIVLDIGDANIFGQHALAYCTALFLCLERRRQILVFPSWQQSVYIAPLMLLSQAVMWAIRMATGSPNPGGAYFIGPIFAAGLWPFLCHFVRWPQRKEKPAEL
ncbi:rod shape-determining protein MreD [Burkholderiaceae bacterium DAT-1]|nr:rod shape-determining protein MreD [Burkholderiaceae bacterium DAT-1]